MESNFFQLNRFLNLTKREIYNFLDSKYVVLSVVGGLSLLMVLINTTIDFSSFSIAERAESYINIVKFIFLLSPIFFYRNINHQQKGLIDVLLPASTFEKFLKMQLFCFFIIPLIFLSLFVIFDMFFSIILSSNEAFYLIFSKIIKSLKLISGSELWKILFYSQLLFLLNLFTKSHKILKILGIFILAYIAILLIFVIISYTLFSTGEIVVEFIADWLNIDFMIGETYNIDLSGTIWHFLFHVFSYGIIIGIAVGSYFKLKSLRY